MDESYVILDDNHQEKSNSWHLNSDSENEQDDLNLSNSDKNKQNKQSTNQTTEKQPIEKSNETTSEKESYREVEDMNDVNVNEILSVLVTKTSAVHKVISNKDLQKNAEVCKSSVEKITEAIKSQSTKRNALLDFAKQTNETILIKEKIKSVNDGANKLETQQDSNKKNKNQASNVAYTKTVNDDYENDSNNMQNLVKILNKKQDSLLNIAKVNNDAILLTDNVPQKELSDNNNNNKEQKINDTGVKSSDGGDITFKKLVDDTNSETQLLLARLKSNKQQFLQSILD